MEIKTNQGGQYIETPAPGSWADALGALATSYAAKRKYDMDQNNALRNALAPTFASGMTMQAPEGATINDFMAQMNGIGAPQQGGGFMGMGMGQPAAGATGANRPWLLGTNPKNQQEADLNKANIAEKEQSVLKSKEDVMKSQYDRSGSAAVQKAALGTSDEYAKTASLGLNLPGAMPQAQAMLQAGMSMQDVMNQIAAQNQAGAPQQQQPKAVITRAQIVAGMKSKGIKLTKQSYDKAVQQLSDAGYALDKSQDSDLSINA